MVVELAETFDISAAVQPLEYRFAYAQYDVVWRMSIDAVP